MLEDPVVVQGTRAFAKEGVIQFLGVGTDHLAQFLRHSEGDQEVGHRQQFILLPLGPGAWPS